MDGERKPTSQEKFYAQNLLIGLIVIAFGAASDANWETPAIEQSIEKVADYSTLFLSSVRFETASLENSHISQIADAAEKEAIAYMEAMNRGQQAYRIEYPTFAASIDMLELGIPEQTRDYRYQIMPQGNGAQSVIMIAQALQPGIRSFAAAAVLAGDDRIARTILCASEQPSTTPPLPIVLEGVNTAPECPLGSTVVK